MPLTPKGDQVLAQMTKEYGRAKAEKIFYASIQSGKLTGMEQSKLDAAIARCDAAKKSNFRIPARKDGVRETAMSIDLPKPGAKDARKDGGEKFRFDAEWNESDHPRASDGKFGSGGSGGKSVAKMQNKNTTLVKHEAKTNLVKNASPVKHETKTAKGTAMFRKSQNIGYINKLENMANAELPKNVDWSHVGSLAHFHEKLSKLSEMLNNTGEYANKPSLYTESNTNNVKQAASHHHAAIKKYISDIKRHINKPIPENANWEHAGYHSEIAGRLKKVLNNIQGVDGDGDD